MIDRSQIKFIKDYEVVFETRGRTTQNVTNPNEITLEYDLSDIPSDIIQKISSGVEYANLDVLLRKYISKGLAFKLSPNRLIIYTGHPELKYAIKRTDEFIIEFMNLLNNI